MANERTADPQLRIAVRLFQLPPTGLSKSQRTASGSRSPYGSNPNGHRQFRATIRVCLSGHEQRESGRSRRLWHLLRAYARTASEYSHTQQRLRLAAVPDYNECPGISEHFSRSPGAGVSARHLRHGPEFQDPANPAVQLANRSCVRPHIERDGWLFGS